MRQLTYLLILLGALLAAGWLEVVFRTRVVVRWRRLLVTLIPIFLIFATWDAYAIGAGHWWFDATAITGVTLGPLPLDEVLFFIVIPYCAILTLEAVRVARGWTVGDEPTNAEAQS